MTKVLMSLRRVPQQLLPAFRHYAHKKPSPYTILGIRPSATVDQIKTAFRKLAKELHPDLKQHDAVDSAKTPYTFHDILAAYEQLLEPDFGGGRDSRVALACEVLTLEELMRDFKHDVRCIQLVYAEGGEDEITPTNACPDVPTDSVFYQVMAHPDDSISDLKHFLEEKYASEWCLVGRSKDRYGLATGWELVVSKGDELEILGNHWFLHTYHLHHQEKVYAVIRKDDEDS